MNRDRQYWKTTMPVKKNSFKIRMNTVSSQNDVMAFSEKFPKIRDSHNFSRM
jgi:hypothetical protein